MAIIVENPPVDQTSNPNCISRITSTIQKGMSPPVLPQAMDKIEGQKEENSEGGLEGGKLRIQTSLRLFKKLAFCHIRLARMHAHTH